MSKKTAGPLSLPLALLVIGALVAGIWFYFENKIKSHESKARDLQEDTNRRLEDMSNY